jgi:hypothetical protein
MIIGYHSPMIPLTLLWVLMIVRGMTWRHNLTLSPMAWLSIIFSLMDILVETRWQKTPGSMLMRATACRRPLIKEQVLPGIGISTPTP